MKIDGLNIQIGKAQSVSLFPDLQLEEGRQITAKIIDLTGGEALLEIGGRRLSAKIEGNPPQLIPGSVLTVRVGSDAQGRILLKIVNSQGEQPAADQTPLIGQDMFLSSSGSVAIPNSATGSQPLLTSTLPTNDSQVALTIVAALIENGLPPQPENIAKIARLLQIFDAKYQLPIDPKVVAFVMAQKWPVNSGNLLTTWLLQDRALRNALWNGLQEAGAGIPEVEQFLASLRIDMNQEADSMANQLRSIFSRLTDSAKTEEPESDFTFPVKESSTGQSEICARALQDEPSRKNSPTREMLQQITGPDDAPLQNETQTQSNPFRVLGDEETIDQLKTSVLKSGFNQSNVEPTILPAPSEEITSPTLTDLKKDIFPDPVTPEALAVSNPSKIGDGNLKPSESAVSLTDQPFQGNGVITDPNQMGAASEQRLFVQASQTSFGHVDKISELFGSLGTPNASLTEEQSVLPEVVALKTEPLLSGQDNPSLAKTPDLNGKGFTSPKIILDSHLDFSSPSLQTKNDQAPGGLANEAGQPGSRAETGLQSQNIGHDSTVATVKTENNASQQRAIPSDRNQSVPTPVNGNLEGKDTGLPNVRPGQKNLPFEQSILNEIGRSDKTIHIKEAASVKEAAAAKMMALLEQNFDLQKATQQHGTVELYNAMPFVIRDSANNLHEARLEWRSQPGKGGRDGPAQYVTMTVPTENMGEIRIALTLDQAARIHFRVDSEEVRQFLAQHTGVLQKEIGRTAAVTVSISEPISPEPLWNGVDIRI